MFEDVAERIVREVRKTVPKRKLSSGRIELLTLLFVLSAAAAFVAIGYMLNSLIMSHVVFFGGYSALWSFAFFYLAWKMLSWSERTRMLERHDYNRASQAYWAKRRH